MSKRDEQVNELGALIAKMAEEGIDQETADRAQAIANDVALRGADGWPITGRMTPVDTSHCQA